MYPVPREFANGTELVREARAVRARLWPVSIPELESKLAPQCEPCAIYAAFIIYDDAYADMLRGWWSPVESERKQRRIKIERIQHFVARYYNVTRGDLISSCRTANVVYPRQVAMYLVRTMTVQSLPEIGRRFGKRDHTTVLHAVRKIERNIKSDAELAATVAEFVRQIEEWSVEPRAEAGG